MNDKEKAAFRAAFLFYDKWREIVIETQAQWDALAEDVGAYAKENDIDNCPIAWNLIVAVLETINDLYHDGRKPGPANFFGRDDL